MSDDRLYLVHILECISRIEKYTVDGKSRFAADTMVQDAVMRNLQILAESTQKLSKELKDAHPDIEWASISGFRNILVHAYLGIKLNRIWNVVSQDIPALKIKTEAMIKDLDSKFPLSPPGTIPFDP